jgi:hypothetical protein
MRGRWAGKCRRRVPSRAQSETTPRHHGREIFQIKGHCHFILLLKNGLIATKTLPHEKSVGEDASDSLDGCP